MPPIRVLLVDDESALLGLLKRHLERAGYDVVAVLSAELAEQALAPPEAPPFIPDLLIADESLPGASGTTLAISLLTRFPDLVCLLCSGFPISLDPLPPPLRSRAAILQKPYLPPAITAAASALLAARR
jgi:CheY-like chemotaxis protein